MSASLRELVELLRAVTNTAQVRRGLIGKPPAKPRAPGARKIKHRPRRARRQPPTANAMRKLQAARRRKDPKAMAYWQKRTT